MVISFANEVGASQNATRMPWDSKGHGSFAGARAHRHATELGGS
jgi:hypothetical protein